MVLARQAGELATYTYTHAGEGEDTVPVIFTSVTSPSGASGMVEKHR